MKVSDLVEDLTIYPRNIIDDVWISSLAHHLRNGAIFPPILVDKKSKRIVDGFHRRRAYIRVHGPECDIPAEVVQFKDDAEIFIEAMRRNGLHGKPLSTVDRIRCVDRGRVLGVAIEIIANTLNVEVRKLEVNAEIRITHGPQGETVIVKAGMNKPDGLLSIEQKRVVNAAFGKVKLYASLLSNLLRGDMLDLSIGGLEDLYILRDILNEKLPDRGQ